MKSINYIPTGIQEMKSLINVQGKWYHLLLMSGGRAHLSKPMDVYNEVERSTIIWEAQPFFYENEVWYGRVLRSYYTLIRALLCRKIRFKIWLSSLDVKRMSVNNVGRSDTPC